MIDKAREFWQSRWHDRDFNSIECMAAFAEKQIAELKARLAAAEAVIDYYGDKKRWHISPENYRNLLAGESGIYKAQEYRKQFSKEAKQ